MKENLKKAKMISKITGQVTEYYLENGVKNFQIKIDKNDEEYIIYAFGYADITIEKIDKMKKSMSIHRDAEYDEYWELMGEGEDTESLILVARICDSVNINYEDDILELTLKKKFI